MLTHPNQKCLLPTVWESCSIHISLQPRHLTFIFPANERTNGAGRVGMISPLVLLSEPTALSAGVQNSLASWEIWFNAEGQRLSLGRGAIAAK